MAQNEQAHVNQHSEMKANFRIDPKLRDFFQLCKEKHGAIGFQYDGESLNFGLIIGKKP